MTSRTTPGRTPSVATLTRREEIIRAAARFFADVGYHTAGMRDIARAVGIQGASLYNHFESKEEILYAVTLTVTRDLVDHQVQVLEIPANPAQRLAALVRAHLLHLVDHHVEHVVGTREIKGLTPAHFHRQLEYRRYYQRRVRDVITAGVKSGEFALHTAPRRAAVALLDLLNGISFWYREGLDIETTIDEYIDLAVHGLLRSRSDVDELRRFARESWPVAPETVDE